MSAGNYSLHVSRRLDGELGVNLCRQDGKDIDADDIDLLAEVLQPTIVRIFDLSNRAS